MTDFDDVLKLSLTDASPLRGNVILDSIIRPTRSGLNALAVPLDSVGLAYRVNGTSLERLLVTLDDISVQASVDIGTNAVQIAASSDGRLVAVACSNGSLQCFNATQDGFSQRWTIPQVHDHVVNDIFSSPSISRAMAGSSSGPVRSLSFAPCGYYLLLVNNSEQRSSLQIFNAAESSLKNLSALPTDIQASSACWSTGTDANSNHEHQMAVGDTTGSIHFYKFATNSATLQKLSTIPFPGSDDGEGWSCTHLEWFGKGSSVAAGFCRVSPSSEDEDEDDEDCIAEHEANLFLTEMEIATSQPLGWTELGDVVPFFSVPKNGRHVYFTTHCQTTKGASFLVVATNVGSDVAVLVKDSDNPWTVAEIPDGSNPTTPTDEDDEYTFPMGLGTVRDAESGQQLLLLAATDGSLSEFQFSHDQDPDYFVMQSTSVTMLPDDPVPEEMSSALAGPPENKSEAQVQSSMPSTGFSLGATPEVSGNSGFSLGATGTVAFGSSTGFIGDADKAAFGTSTFGSTVSSEQGKYAFGSTGYSQPPAATSAAAAAATSTGNIFGSTGGSSLFGSSTGGGDFGELAKKSAADGGGFGSVSTSQPGFVGFGNQASTSSSIFGKGGNSAFGGASTEPSAFGGLAFGSPRDKAFENGVGEDESETNSNDDDNSESDDEDKESNAGETLKSTTFGFGSGRAAGSGVTLPGFGSPAFAISEKSSGGGTNPFAFGSGAAFGSGSAPSFKSSSPFTPMKPTLSAKDEPSQFNIFGKPPVASGVNAMAKPLFGSISSQPKKESAGSDPVTSSPSKIETPARQAEPTPPPMAKQHSDTAESTFLGPTAKKAAQVFDMFDKDKQGSLPAEMFENMQDELGEGFHGAEMDRQIKAIDKDQAGLLKRAEFIKWYVALVENQSDEESDDSEREEEMEKATNAFMKFARKEDNNDVIDAADFEKVFTSMNTVYCEEAHKKTIDKLRKPSGLIHLKDFVVWYLDWLFDDDDEESLSDEERSEENNDKKNTVTVASAEGWGDTFKVAENTWQCKVCMVRNEDTKSACVSCETLRPGFEARATTASSASTIQSSSAISSSGFTFGGSSSSPKPVQGSSIGANGFTFGGGTSSSSSAPGSAASGGFTFGTASGSGSGSVFSSSSGTGFQFAAPTLPGGNEKGKDSSTKGFTSGTKPPMSAKKQQQERPPEETSGELDGPIAKRAALAFDSLDKDKKGILPGSKFEDLQDEIGEGFHGEEMEKQIHMIDPTNSGSMKRTAFIRWYVDFVGKEDNDDASLDDSELQEREEEKIKASNAFMAMSKTEDGQHVIEADDFGKLLESMQTTYCEEEHRKTVRKLAKPKISHDDFVEWYIGWLFAGDEDSESDYDDQEPSSGNVTQTNTEKELQPGTAKPVTSSWGDTFKVDASTWQCHACMVRNKDTIFKCVACETIRPGHEGSQSESQTAPTALMGDGSKIGKGGFTFGGSSSTDTTGTFSFGSSGTQAGSSISSKGISFGASASATGSTISSSGFTFGRFKSPESATKPSDGDNKKVEQETKVSGNLATQKNASLPKKSDISSAASPPMSNKAPTPFGGSSSKPASTASGSSAAAFPPMSNKAPTPFGGSSSKPASTASGSSAAAFPPMSFKAPTPFGGSSSKPASTASGSSAAAFPPMSNKAPTPFGGSSSKPASTASGSSAAGSSAAAFPPISNKAPTPFGMVSPSQESNPYGDHSRKGRSPSSMSRRSPTQQAQPSPVPTSAETTLSRREISRREEFATSEALAPSPNMSECEQQFISVVNQLNSTLEKLARGRPQDTDSLQEPIEKLLNHVQKLKADCTDSDQLRSVRAKEVAFLLSRKTDASRQVAEARSLIDTTQNITDGSRDILSSQPLDQDSERRRRQLKAKVWKVKKLLDSVRERLDFIHKICSPNANEARVDLMKEVLRFHDRTNFLKDFVSQLDRKIGDMSRKVPRVPNKHSSAKKAVSRRVARITPLPVPEESKAVRKQTGSSLVDANFEQWAGVEASLQTLQNHVTRAELSKLRLTELTSLSTSEVGKKQNKRELSQSLLLPPSAPASTSAVVLRPENTAFESPFSTIAAPRARPGWNKSSDFSQAQQLSLSLPDDLKEVTFSGAAKGALAPFGTTPEKVREATGVAKSGISPKPSPRQRSGVKDEKSETAGEKKKASSSAAFPPLPSKAPTNPFAKKTSSDDDKVKPPKKLETAGFPPMSKVAPKPVPSTSDQSLKPPSMPSMSVKDALSSASKGIAGSSFNSEKVVPEKTENSAFGSLGGLGSALLSSPDENKSPSAVSTTLGGPNQGTATAGSVDYKGILEKFYTANNPAKVQEADKHLEKYRGREKELFYKLAKKYNVPNPLDNLPSNAAAPATSSTTAVSTPFGSSQLSSPSPFGSSQPSAPSPFGSQQAPASTPFGGKQAPSSTPFGGQQASAPAPFGGQQSSAQSTFGSTPADAPGIFGSTSTQAPAPFGSTSAFGSPSTPAFGSAQPLTPQPPTNQQESYVGKQPRDMLIAFYQRHNPSKVAEVDKHLGKYNGRVEQLFMALAKKYNVDPKVFGLPPAAAAAAAPTSGFGSPSVGFGSPPTATPGFGQPSVLGGGPSPFGGGFGQPSPLGGQNPSSTGMSLSAGGSTPFGGQASAGFGGQSFGALASQGGQPSFGSPAPSGFGASPFGGAGNTFGSPTPFGAPRR